MRSTIRRPSLSLPISCPNLQGHLAQKKQPPHRTLQKDYAWFPMAILEVGAVSYAQGTPVLNSLPYTRSVAHTCCWSAYRGTSIIRNCLLVGPYSRTMPRALRWSLGGGQFLIGEIPL